MRTDGETRNPNQMHQIAMQHMKKRKPAKPPVFSPVLWQGQKDLSRLPPRSAGRSPQATSAPRHAPGRRVPAGALVAKSYRTLTKSQAPHKRYLTFLAGAEGLEPRHAVLEWDVGENTSESGKGRCHPVPTASPQKAGAGLRWEEFSEPKQAKKGGKSRKS